MEIKIIPIIQIEVTNTVNSLKTKNSSGYEEISGKNFNVLCKYT